MKAPQLLTLLIAFLLGAGLILGIGQFNKEDDSGLKDDLADAKAEIDKLKLMMEKRLEEQKKPITLPSALPEPEVVALSDAPPEPDEPEADEDVSDDPADAIRKLMNSKEARGMAKQWITAMGKQSDAWVERGIGEYREKLNLSDVQVARLKTRLTDRIKQQSEAAAAKFDDESLSIEEIMEGQREQWQGQEAVMSEILKEELDEEQFAQFEREQLIEKTERVQNDSDRELQRLNRDLNLTESQQDEVFGILVRTNSDYDESMAIEGAGGAVVPAGDEVVKEDAIRSVLDAEQSAKYNESLENRAQRRGNPFGRGFGR